MLVCKEIVEIASSNKKLSIIKKMEFRFHLLMCKHCHAYVEQLKIMNVQYKKVFKKITDVDDEHVKQLEDEIIEKLFKDRPRKK
ncbi:MAG: hypothetical protein ACXVCQ_19265 [Bacteriovorax sp.]